jgi:hypothetical protein
MLYAKLVCPRQGTYFRNMHTLTYWITLLDIALGGAYLHRCNNQERGP